MSYFPNVPKIQYEGPRAEPILHFVGTNPDEVVEGKTMKEHFRFSIVVTGIRCVELAPIRLGQEPMYRPWDEGVAGVDQAFTPNRSRL